MRVSTSNQTLPLSYFALVFPTGIKADVRPLADRSPIIIICPTRCDTLVIHRFVPVPPFVIVSPFFFVPSLQFLFLYFFFPFLRSLFFRPFFPTLFFRFSLSLSLSRCDDNQPIIDEPPCVSHARWFANERIGARFFLFFLFFFYTYRRFRFEFPSPVPSPPFFSIC